MLERRNIPRNDTHALELCTRIPVELPAQTGTTILQAWPDGSAEVASYREAMLWIRDPARARPDRPLRVLVAEDHPVNRQYMSALLEGMGHQAHFAADGAAAVQAIREQFDTLAAPAARKVAEVSDLLEQRFRELEERLEARGESLEAVPGQLVEVVEQLATRLEHVNLEQRLFPVGRLDYDSEGLLLLTDDGELTQKLTHPSYQVEKEYRVLLNESPSPNALRAWRRQQAQDQGVPAYVIFHDRTLAEIASRRPASLDALAGVPGVGQSKLDRYGAAVLALLSRHRT